MSNKLDKDLPLKQWLEAERTAAALRSKLAEVEQKATELRPDVDQLIAAAAQRWLVDEAGQPMDSGVYWYSHLALVRVNGTVKLIPVETMDEAKVFAAPAPAEAEVKEAESA